MNNPPFPFRAALAALFMLVVSKDATAQMTVFNYQGQLSDKGALAVGNYDFRFTAFAAESGGTASAPSAAMSLMVTNGAFSAKLDLGPGVFNGESRWLEIGVRTNGAAEFTILSPRQFVSPVPYALYAFNGATALATNLARLDASQTFTAPQEFAGETRFDADIRAFAGGTLISPGRFHIQAGEDLYLNPHLPAGDVFIGGGSATSNLRVTGEAIIYGGLSVPSPSILRQGENAVLRAEAGQLQIGQNRIHTNTSIAGIFDAPLSNGVPVYVTPSGQLGTGPGLSPRPGLGLQVPNALRVTETDGKGMVLDVYGDEASGAYVFSAHRLHINAAGKLYLNAFAPNGEVVIGGGTGTANLNVTGDGQMSTLTIRGGADLAEPFEIQGGKLSEGSLVIIDSENPGKVRISSNEYDNRVAGIVSGANGIQPGLSLTQKGKFDAGQNIALSGRVYALADASTQPIKPGDLLTTSSTPGHCMKVSDHSRAQGAVIGKAMSGLGTGKGMVLVLVSLQ